MCQEYQALFSTVRPIVLAIHSRRGHRWSYDHIEEKGFAMVTDRAVMGRQLEPLSVNLLR